NQEQTMCAQIQKVAIERDESAVSLIRGIGRSVVGGAQITPRIRVVRILLVGDYLVDAPCALSSTVILIGVHIVAEVIEKECVLRRGVECFSRGAQNSVGTCVAFPIGRIDQQVIIAALDRDRSRVVVLMVVPPL